MAEEHICIRINTGNAAFGDAPATELGRILRKLAENIEQTGDFGTLRDSNGNTCGTVTVQNV